MVCYAGFTRLRDLDALLERVDDLGPLALLEVPQPKLPAEVEAPHEEVAAARPGARVRRADGGLDHLLAVQVVDDLRLEEDLVAEVVVLDVRLHPHARVAPAAAAPHQHLVVGCDRDHRVRRHAHGGDAHALRLGHDS